MFESSHRGVDEGIDPGTDQFPAGEMISKVTLLTVTTVMSGHGGFEGLRFGQTVREVHLPLHFRGKIKPGAKIAIRASELDLAACGFIEPGQILSIH